MARRFYPESVESILVIRLYFIGDVLLSTPVFEALGRRFPDARLTVLVKRRCRDILAGNPYVDDVIVYDAVDHYHSKPRYTGCVIYANQTNHHEHNEVLEPKAYYTLYSDIAGFGEGVGSLDQDPLFVPLGEGEASGTAESALFGAVTFQEFKEQSEKLFLERKLQENGGNVSQTARLLDMQRSNLYKKIEKFELGTGKKGPEEED